MGNGNANFDSTLGVQRYFIDLALAAQYDASQLESPTSATDQQRWRRCFEEVSRMLFEATEGQMQLGTLYFSNDAPFASETDIFLDNQPGESVTVDPLNPPFNNQVYLRKHVRNEPLVALHELGHYAFTLRDEYVYQRVGPGLLRRLCQDDPSTQECVMEFGAGDGLQLDEQGNVSGSQPLNIVNQFCYANHVPHIENPQEYRHHESCWETMVRVYPSLTLPDGASPSGTHQAVEWIETIAVSRYVLAVAASPHFAATAVALAIKTAAKEWVYRMSQSGDQFAMSLGAYRILPTLQPVTEDNLSALYSSIDAADLDGEEDTQLIQQATSRFPDARGAFHRLALVASGDAGLSVRGLESSLPEKRIQLCARTFGAGELDLQLRQQTERNKWVRHAGFRLADDQQEAYAFTLQNELIELYFSSTPGLGIVDLQEIWLPAALEQSSIAESPAPANIHFEARASGIDIPVYIEHGARAASFLLSQPGPDACQLNVIDPNGKQHQARPHSSPLVHACDLAGEINGRWILSIRRKALGASLPLFVLAAARNPSLGSSVRVSVTEQSVKFRFQTVYRFPLDFVDTTVDIFRLTADQEAVDEPVQSLVLRRQTITGPQQQAAGAGSTSWYVGSTQLPPGPYLAVFRARHHGQATYATNPEGIVNGQVPLEALPPVPTFSRVVRERFEILD